MKQNHMDTQTLRNLDVNRYDLDQMVELSSVAGMLLEHYGNLELEVPDWLLKSRKALLDAIAEKNRGRIEARVKELEARVDALTPAETKRRQLTDELARLRKKLGGGDTVAGGRAREK